MFDSNGEIKFIDFGLAISNKKNDNDYDKVKVNKGDDEMDVTGTILYIAPEVFS